MLAGQEDRWLGKIVVVHLLLNLLLNLSLDEALTALHGIVSHFCRDNRLPGVESDQINKILFSPGFVPQQRVLLETTDIPAPEQPSQTPNMPTPEFITDTPKEVTLKIPATDYNAVLMLNDQYEKDWQVTIDGQPATLLRANGNARAVHLPAASNERTVTFTYPPHDLLTLPSTLAVFLGLGIAGIGSFRNWRRFLREEMESDADESIDDTDSSEDPKPDET